MPQVDNEGRIRCPDCYSPEMRVLYTRHRMQSIQRVRACARCGKRVITREHVQRAIDNARKPKTDR